MKIVIFEGARGVGKSTLVKMLRDSMTNTVAINLTGNNRDDEEGKNQTLKHYENVLTFLGYEGYDNSPYNYIFDRIFFSEKVYSDKYKSYVFKAEYLTLLERLDRIASQAEVVVLHLTTNKEGFERNLKREGKADLFDNAEFSDDVHKNMEQNTEYFNLFKEARSLTENIVYKTVDLTNLTLDESLNYIKSLI